MEILCIGSEEYILELEEKALVLYDCVENGYNILSNHPNKLGVSMPESSRKAMSDSLLKFYKENPNYLKENRRPRKVVKIPVYVSGFWFDCKNTALDKLKMNDKTFYRRRNKGILGEVCIPQSKSIIYKPYYILGIWFPNLIQASSSLRKSGEFLQKLIREEDLEEKLIRIGTKPQSKPSSEPVGVNMRENGKFRAVLIYNKKRLLSKTFENKEDAATAYDDCYESIHGIRPNKTIREVPE